MLHQVGIPKALHMTFIQANRSLFFYEGSPIDKSDQRVHSIPFSTNRPTQMEIKRIHQILSTLEYVEEVEEENVENTTDPVQPATTSETAEKAPEQKIERSEEPNLLLEAVREGNLEKVHLLLKQEYIPPISSKEDVTPLYQSILSGNLEITKELIRQNLDLDVQESNDSLWTPLHKYLQHLHLLISKSCIFGFG